MFTEVKNGYVNKDAVPLETVSITEALAVAYAAYRINNNTYTKDTRRFSCEENKTQFDNKESCALLLGKQAARLTVSSVRRL